MSAELTSLEQAVLLVHLTSTWFMVGLIWMVQRVSYPAFGLVDGDGTEYHAHHTRRIGPIVGPPMGLEAITAVWLVVDPPADLGRLLPLVGLGVLGVVQASTAFLQVPSHDRLARGMGSDEVIHIVRTNWIRTVGWTVRGGLAVLFLLNV